VISVKNEHRLIRDNVLYHRYLGASAVYVYDDGCTDGTMESLADIDIVVARKSITPDELPPLPPWLPEDERRCLLGNAGINCRKAANCAHAMCLARARGIEWMLQIDADELIYPFENLRPNRLVELLASIHSDFNVVRFPSVEVLPVSEHVDRAFSDCTYFIRQISTCSTVLFDVYENEEFVVPTPMVGHFVGKVAARLSAPVFASGNPHRFEEPDHRRTEVRLSDHVWCLLHFQSYDYTDFFKKHTNFSSESQDYSGTLYSIMQPPTVVRHKSMWRRMANDPAFGEEGLRAYYVKWILNSQAYLAIQLQQFPLCGIVFIDELKKLFLTKQLTSQQYGNLSTGLRGLISS